MRNKNEVPSQESGRRGPRAVQSYDEKMPRHKSKVADSQDDRDRNSPMSRHRSMAIRPHERERDRAGKAYYQSRSSHASKLMSSEEAQKSIRTLYMQVKETTSFFTNFREGYQGDIRRIETYAGQTILEKLWERKIRHSDGKSRLSKGHAKDDGVGSRSAFDDVSDRLWNSLVDAYEGARSHPSSQNDGLARKLETAIKDFDILLDTVRTHCQEIDNLIKELKLLKMVLELELESAGMGSSDDKARQRSRGRTTGLGHQRDSNPGGDDARYGGVGEDSESEDNGQRDEQHGEHTDGRDEGEVGGDEEGQGAGGGGGNSWED